MFSIFTIEMSLYNCGTKRKTRDKPQKCFNLQISPINVTDGMQNRGLGLDCRNQLVLNNGKFGDKNLQLRCMPDLNRYLRCIVFLKLKSCRKTTHVLQDKLAYVQVTADILQHKYAPRRNACPLNGCTFLWDVMNESELTPKNSIMIIPYGQLCNCIVSKKYRTQKVVMERVLQFRIQKSYLRAVLFVFVGKTMQNKLL